MIRNLANLANRTYDVVVIGGGIYGVCIAWDACQRGLSVALVEKEDFGGATSSNSLRVIHGGLRYLQQGDIRRVRRSIYERTAFMRIAPHLVQPLPILIPTYGRSLRGKQIFSLALFLNRLIGIDLNGREFPSSRIVSKQECLRLFPGVNERGLTGGVIVYDCQMSNSERLVLSFAQSAAKAGAELANYVECTDLLNSRGRIAGITARDVLGGADEFTISARVVVNASGPWIDRVLAPLDGTRLKSRSLFSKAFNLLINRQLVPHQGVGVYSQSGHKDRDAILHKGSRLFFIMPWQGRSLIGTAHLPHDGDPENSRVHETEVQAFLNEINDAYPTAALKLADVDHVYSGLLPVVEPGGVQLMRHHRIYDHRDEDQMDGLISVSGVKFTEARYVAEKAVDAVFLKLAKQPPKSMTAVTPLHDGYIRNLDDYLSQQTRQRSREFKSEIVEPLISHYGSAYSGVLDHLGRSSDSETATDVSPVIEAEVRYALKEEMAQKLADVVFRRTTLGRPGNLTETSLGLAAVVMAREFAWSEEKLLTEMEEVRAVLPHIAFERGKAA